MESLPDFGNGFAEAANGSQQAKKTASSAAL